MKANKIYLHDAAQHAITVLSKQLPHALLLTGRSGVGLSTIAHSIAVQAGRLITEIMPDEKGTIGIDTIRDLYTQTRSKQQKRTIVIDDADNMTHTAQNALLKLLEEPGESVSFILTTHKPEGLLQTIRSRTQQMNIPLISQVDTDRLLNELGVSDAATRSQLTFMAGGRPAEMVRLVSSGDYFDAEKEVVRDARQYLQGSAYEKTMTIHKYSADRAKAHRLLEAALAILTFSLKSGVQEALIAQLDTIVDTQERLRGNRHIKTQLLRSIF